ncbi:RNA polymerase sigma factor, partial [Klebsiella pneumoniae]
VQKGTVPSLTVAWLIGVARHKMVDHWRATAREERRLHRVASEPEPDHDDPLDAHLDAATAREVLAELGPHHRAALTLR